MSLNSPTARRIDGTKLRFGIVAARFNEELVAALLSRLVTGLKARGFCFATLREHPAYRAWILRGGK